MILIFILRLIGIKCVDYHIGGKFPFMVVSGYGDPKKRDFPGGVSWG